MRNKTFEELLELNCFSADATERQAAADLLDKYYNCEIHCTDMARSVLFAHHARGCTIVAAKICENVVIYQSVTIGTNMRYNRESKKWENVGNPILSENVIVSDGAKILGPVVIGENTVIGAGAIVTKDIPADSVAYGVNQYRPRNPNYDLVFRPNLPSEEKIQRVNERLIAAFEQTQACQNGDG